MEDKEGGEVFVHRETGSLNYVEGHHREIQK